MKLAEALQERADLNRKIEQLNRRLSNNILVQEGEDPAECPQQLLRELDDAIARLEYLMAAINRTNCVIKADGITLTELIAKKDALLLKISAYRRAAGEASMSTDRARGTEIKVKSVIKASELQKLVDQMSKELRLLDNRLQATNWTVDLIEE